MTKLDDYTSKAPAIIGSTTINHAVRVALQITCSEYCFLDFLTKVNANLEQPDVLNIFIKTGFSTYEQEILLKALMQKSLVIIESGIDGRDRSFKVASKWNDAFPNLDKEFEEFWHGRDKEGNLTVVWTGTKKKALEYYVKLRKKYSKEFLAKQRDLYFEFLQLEQKGGFNRQKMMCQIFLNPMNERFNEDYEDYCKQKRIKLGIDKLPEVKPMTKEEVLGAYGKDNNK